MFRPVLFHWSPLHRRHSISTLGLKTDSPNTISTQPVPYISLSPDPKAAWELCPKMARNNLRGDGNAASIWDLWMVEIPSQVVIDTVRSYGVIEEVRAYDSIPPEYIWRCGTRSINHA